MGGLPADAFLSGRSGAVFGADPANGPLAAAPVTDPYANPGQDPVANPFANPDQDTVTDPYANPGQEPVSDSAETPAPETAPGRPGPDSR